MSSDKPADDSKTELDELSRLGFEDSTQRKYWLFSDEESLHQRFLASFAMHTKKIKEIVPSVKIPSNEEYLVSLSYFCKEIIEICRKFSFPPYVSCTAVTYFKRVFLNNSSSGSSKNKWSLINMDGMALKDTCIYLATKTEQCLIPNVQHLTNFTKVPPQQVIDGELLLMDGINFHLKIWSPLRPFRSFVSDFKSVYKQRQKHALPDRYERQISTLGQALMQDSYISNVCLLYTPSQIALACLLLVLSSIDQNATNATPQQQSEMGVIKQMSIAYFKQRFGNHGDDQAKQTRFATLKQTVQDIQKMMLEAMTLVNESDTESKHRTKTANTKVWNLRALYVKIELKAKQKLESKKLTQQKPAGHETLQEPAPSPNPGQPGTVSGGQISAQTVVQSTAPQQRPKKIMLKIRSKRKLNPVDDNPTAVKKQKI